MCIHICHIYFVIKFKTIKIVTVISLLKSTPNFIYYEIPYFNSKCVYNAVGGLPYTIPLGGGSRTCGIKDIDPEDQVRNWSRLIYYGCGDDLYIFLQVPKGCCHQKDCAVHFSLVHITWPDIASHLAQHQILGLLKRKSAVHMFLLPSLRSFHFGCVTSWNW